MRGDSGAPPIPNCRSLSLLGERSACTLWAADSDAYGGAVTVTVYTRPLDEESSARFEQAVEVATRLGRHPNLVTIHASGYLPGDRAYVVSDGHDRTTAEGVLLTGGVLSVEPVLRVGIALAGALETAHRAGVVHGGVAPALVLLRSDGQPVLTETGLGEFGQPAGISAALDRTIPYHAPPEVLEGTDLSPATDVYSLASVVYTLLVGQAPHASNGLVDSTASLLLRILQMPMPSIQRSDVPPGLEDALRTALAHVPGKRPQQVLELAWSLQDAQRMAGMDVTEPVVDGDGGPGADRPRPQRASLAASGLAGALPAAGGVAPGGALPPGDPADQGGHGGTGRAAGGPGLGLTIPGRPDDAGARPSLPRRGAQNEQPPGEAASNPPLDIPLSEGPSLFGQPDVGPSFGANGTGPGLGSPFGANGTPPGGDGDPGPPAELAGLPEVANPLNGASPLDVSGPRGYGDLLGNAPGFTPASRNLNGSNGSHGAPAGGQAFVPNGLPPGGPPAGELPPGLPPGPAPGAEGSSDPAERPWWAPFGTTGPAIEAGPPALPTESWADSDADLPQAHQAPGAGFPPAPGGDPAGPGQPAFPDNASRPQPAGVVSARDGATTDERPAPPGGATSRRGRSEQPAQSRRYEPPAVSTRPRELGERTTALERARQARLERQQREREGGAPPAGAAAGAAGDKARDGGQAPTRTGPPALPVIVLVAVVVLLGLGGAYLVVTGEDSPGSASTTSSSTTNSTAPEAPAPDPANGAANLRAVEAGGGVQLDWDGPDGAAYTVRILSATEPPRSLPAGPATALMIPGDQVTPGGAYCFDVAGNPPPADPAADPAAPTDTAPAAPPTEGATAEPGDPSTAPNAIPVNPLADPAAVGAQPTPGPTDPAALPTACVGGATPESVLRQ